LYDRDDPNGNAAGILKAVSAGDAGAADIISVCRDAIDAREADVLAWQALDWDSVAAQVQTLENRDGWRRLPLAGVPVGIKDIFDTADFPTTYGSPIYEGHRPAGDAAAVARLREAGAIVIGKTVSTEFAYWRAGKTRNPLDRTRSPGGSSSGSAAAVAAGMVPLAIGSQTAASTIRPAAYCGIVGFKPTRGRISLAGVKALANGFDTVGVFARTVSGAGCITSVLCGDARLRSPLPLEAPARFAAVRDAAWSLVDAAAMAQFDDTLAAIRGAGGSVDERAAGQPFDTLTRVQTLMMASEAARELAHEHRVHAERLSLALRELLTDGEAITAARYADACRLREKCLLDEDALFGDAEFLLAPSTTGEAPLFEDGTGSPDMSRAWMMLDLPAITVPAGKGPNGMPLGIQIAARRHADDRLLQAAAWLEVILSGQRP
jgi:Asp-tRNA(Asn)/Glu-tRNA(Gln) amidotransferase A subunit family amidase